MPQFYSPRTIIQYAEYPEADVSWSNNQADSTIIDTPDYNFADPNTGAGNKNIIQTVKNLSHIPNPTRGPKLDKTYYLKCTNFNIRDLPSTITGITVTINAQRYGRIVDETVCLIHNDQIISENKTNLQALREGHLRNDNDQTYGNNTDLWGAELTREMLEDESFGLLLRFASNPLYPHRDTIEIYRIVLTVHPFNVFIFDEGIDIEFITEEDPSDYFSTE